MTEATAIYRAIMLEVERRRIALGFPMEKFDEYAGLPDRYFAKALHADRPSGRQAQWATLQIIVDALYPNGFDVEIRPKPGAPATYESLKASLLQLRATVDPRSQRELMRELSKRGAKKGGVARWQNVNARSRARIMRETAKRRWSKPRLVEITGAEARAVGTSLAKAPPTALPPVPQKRSDETDAG